MAEKSNHSEAAVTSDELIRSLVVAQKRIENRNALPELAPPIETAREPDRRSRRARRQSGRLRSLLRSYRPKPRYILWGALALTMLLYPLLLPGLMLLSLAIALIAYLTLGPDRVAELFIGLWSRLAERKPELAAGLRQSADRCAVLFDAVLDRLPESWAEKLALPDLSAAASSRDRHDDRSDPFEKLNTLPDVYRG